MSGKLDQIIKDLLSKIPVIGDRFKSDDDEYEEDQTQVDIEDDEVEDDDEEYEEDSEEEADEDEAAAAKKKKISMIIRGVAIVGIAYLAFDMLMTEEDPNSENGKSISTEATKMTPQQKKIAELSAQRKAAKAKRMAEKAAKLKEEQEAKEKAEAEAKLKAEEEEKRIAAEEAQKKAEEEAAAAAAAAEEESKNDTKAESDDNQTPDARDAAISEVENEISPPEAEEEKSSLVEEEKKKDMVQNTLQYVVPPNYEIMGRGLVYNCKGKFWACVDRKSYFQCRKNERWQKQNSKDLECHIAQVYATDSDCKTVQKYNINMDIPTDFCKAPK